MELVPWCARSPLWLPLVSRALTPRVLPRIWLPYPPPLPPPFSLRDDPCSTCLGLVFGEGGLSVCPREFFSLGARQLRFPSLAPRVERGLPWSLPRPFCLSPGFSFPVDPYRTGEFLLAVSVTPRQSLAAVLHTLCQDSFSPRECFVWTRFYGLAIFAVHAHELTVLLHYAHSGLSFNRRKEIFAIVFFFLCLWQ